MEIETQKVTKIKDGKYTATIKDVERREKPFDYMDYHLELENGVVIKYGVPTNISVDKETAEPSSKHAKLLSALGLLSKNGKSDPEKAKGLKVSCMIANEEKEKGTFANVVEGTIKLE